MRTPVTPVALLLTIVLVACAPAVVTPAPSAPATPSPTIVVRADPTSGPADPTPIPLPADFRPEGPWEVDFARTGETTVREVFVLSPSCSAGACDVDVVIQDFHGTRLGSGVFRYVDGVYVFEDERRTTEACSLSAELVSDGVERTSATSLVLAGYRPPGTAVVTPRIQGQRSIVTRPLDARACEATTAVYVARGQPTKFAREDPTPSPTPKPTKSPTVVVIKPSFFGSGVAVTTYRVRGSTPYDISRSIGTEGPYMSWLGGSAAGVTQARSDYRWHMELAGAGSCRIVREAKPAIRIVHTIVLPRWKAPSDASASTIAWWNTHVRDIARHEKVHVDIYRAAAKRLNSVLASSTCDNVRTRLNRVWKAVRRDQCEFDMREYGDAAGLSLSACLAG